MAAAPFNWNEYLNLATTLSANADEASQRTAISRAYYAAFHAATLHAKANGYAERSHGRLWKMYAADGDLNAKRLSHMGNLMKKMREDADYVASVPRVTDVMTQQLTNATNFHMLLAQVPAASPQLLPPTPKKTCRNCGAVVA
ncbi:MAG TPA: hypothetical protein VG675_12595 [Bryobacteraceae bacterium]|nr:hypothetical protein [Bryobacteraceae bacterium]